MALCNCNRPVRPGEFCCEEARSRFFANEARLEQEYRYGKASVDPPAVSDDYPTVYSQSKKIKADTDYLSARLETLRNRLMGPHPELVYDVSDVKIITCLLGKSVDTVHRCHLILDEMEAVLGLPV